MPARRNSSIIIVDETRGAPLKIISFVMGILWLLRGIQFFFFCGQPVPGIETDRILFSQMGMEDCKTNPFQESMSGLVGIHFIIVAAIRIKTSVTEHVADLYQTMILAVTIDILYVLLIMRCWDAFSQNPIALTMVVPIGCLYEMYILYKARNAYELRSLKYM